MGAFVNSAGLPNVLNPTGHPNSWVEIDLMQEHLNYWIKVSL
jgi:hypothetical protein